MAVTLRFDGIAELKQALRLLPESLTDEAGALVRAQALNAAGAIRATYARGPTGNLQNGVVAEAEQPFSRYGARYVVRSKAKHAYIYEYGTKARHYFTKAGKRHLTGAMPAARVFVRRMIEARARMQEELVWLLVRNGLMVRRAA
jgi:hypothetical protein